jgi:hypothetical protein
MLSVIIGRRRQGKSTLALALAKAQDKTVIVFDPNNQYRALPVISDLSAWIEESESDSIGRIVPQPPVEDAWREIAEILDGGRWEWADYVLILDECSMLMSPHWVDETLERFARTAPKDVDVILTTHRARDIHPLFRALSTDWFVFQTNIALDVDVLRKNFTAELADVVQSLPKYHVAHYWLDEGGIERVVVWDKPETWYVNIGRQT